MAFVERVRPDVVLSLALVHHLTIGANVPLREVVSWLGAFEGRLVVEFVHPDDVHVKRLLPTSRRGCSATIGARPSRSCWPPFLVHDQQRLPGGTRTLYLAEPKP